MKKQANLLIFVITVLLILPVSCFAEEMTFNDFIYQILPDSTVEITKYTGMDEYLEIPEMIDEDPVTSIAEKAFAYNKTLVMISVPETVIYIGDHAFVECTSLRGISLPESLLYLGELAFQGDIELENILLPSSLVHIGTNPFDRCDKLEGIAFSGDNNYYSTENGVLFDSIHNILVAYPAGKTDAAYTIPDWITEIGLAAFSENPHLEGVSIFETLKTMTGNPFCGCVNLKAIRISPFNQYFEIYNNALYNFRESELITYLWGTDQNTYKVQSGTKSIAQEAFYKHKELQTIDLPKTIVSIGSAAFAESGLTEIKIPDNVSVLSDSLFSNCPELKSITLPANLTVIGDYSFFECDALTEIKFPSSLIVIGEGAFTYCTGLTELVFRENLHFIGNYAFLGCSNVKSIDFPSKLLSIGGAAFHEIKDLKVTAEPGSLGEEWALKNGVPVEYKNIEYMNGDIV